MNSTLPKSRQGARSAWRWSSIAIVLALIISSASVPSRELAARAQTPDVSDRQLDRVEAAISRAQAYLWTAQNEAGYWDGSSIFYTPSHPDLMGTTALYVLLLCHLGINNASKRQAVDYLIASQLADGSWGDLDSDYLAVVVLEQAGLSPASSTLQSAYAHLREQGGTIHDQSFFTHFYYALAGQYPWQDVDLPLLDDSGQYSPDKKPNAFRMDAALAFFILKTLHVDGGPSREQRKLLRDAESLLLQRQLPDGSWFNFEQGTIFALLALYELGYDKNQENLVRGLRFLNTLQNPDGSMAIFKLPIFDTALALLALRASGVDKDAQEIERAVEWLVDSRNLSGGWGWTPQSGVTADIDDTSLPIPALLDRAPDVAQEVIALLWTRQNPDGGWGTFGREPRGQQDVPWIPLDSDILFFGDPSIPDGAGHALLALASAGYSVGDERIDRAVGYLQRVQFDNGMWFGWWGIPYLYGTSAVLTGLEAVGADMASAYVQKAVQWLQGCQNADGGWGEDLEARESPAYACQGESTSSQTAWAILGLLAAGAPPDAPAIQAGVAYLLSRQRNDGGWEPALTMLATPPFPYSMAHAEASWPLWALANYRAAIVGDEKEAAVFGKGVVVPAGVLGLSLLLLCLVVVANRRRRRRLGFDNPDRTR